MLIYDLPTDEPVKTLIRNSNLSLREREEAEFLGQRVKAWYKWAVYRLRWLGYLLQLSVVQLPKSNIPAAKRTIDDVLKVIDDRAYRLIKEYGLLIGKYVRPRDVPKDMPPRSPSS